MWQHNFADGVDTTVADDARKFKSSALIARGAYLATAGNCAGCHSTRGGQPYAGGLAIKTPFGTVYSSNLTPDPATGIGGWNAAEFWRAMHHGRSKDGRLLAPAFPYTNTTLVSREDSDALLAFLRSLPGAARPNTPSTLAWPYSTQLALAAWRALYFRPAAFKPEPAQSAEWNRGAYLVNGLAHCSACHAPRNALGGSAHPLDLAGGLIPSQNWYAPSLLSSSEAGVAEWSLAEITGLLKTGLSPRGSVAGPMSEVVWQSTQHLQDTDLMAIAIYLKALPQPASGAEVRPVVALADKPLATQAINPSGGQLYTQHCAQCHGEQGRGVPGAYPALAGNRAVLLPVAANLVQSVLYGGYAPATVGNPRPYGMPPYVLVLSDRDIADVLTHVRSAWGNAALPVSELDVARVRQH